MIDPHHQRLSIARQCALVSIVRSSFYYQGKGGSPLNLALMRQIDAQFLETPWYGSRQMARHLRRQGYAVGRKRVRRLMRVMGLTAIYQKPRTSRPDPTHRIYALPVARPDDRAGGPSLVHRRQLYPHAPWLSVLGGDHGLVVSQSPELAAVQHAGRGVLRRGLGGGPGSPWQAGDLQHRPGMPVHQRGLHASPQGRRREDLDGRPRTVDGQPCFAPILRM